MGLPDVPVHVTAIKLHGNKRTKAEVILAAVCDVEKASTAQELQERLAVCPERTCHSSAFSRVPKFWWTRTAAEKSALAH